MKDEQNELTPVNAVAIKPYSAEIETTSTEHEDKKIIQNGHEKLKRLHKGKSKDKKSKEDEDEKEEEEDDDDEEKKPKIPPPVSMFELFRFAEGIDYFLLFLGLLAAWAAGLGMPAMTILFGRLTNALVDFGASSNTTDGGSCFNLTNGTDYSNESMLTSSSDTTGGMKYMNASTFRNEINTFGIGLSIIGAVQLALSYVFVACLNAAAEKQTFRIRNLFLSRVLRQDIAWYDCHQTGEFASRTSDDLMKLQDGIGEKIGMFNFFVSCFIFSIVNAFVHGWQLTLVMLSITPLMVVCMGALGMIQSSQAKKEMAAYAVAGSIAEEVLTAIRTVVAFGGEMKEVDRYTSNLVHARSAGIKRGSTTAVGAGALWFIIYCSYALAFWYGIKLILDDGSKYDASDLVIVFFSVLMGAMNMGQSPPYIEAFSQARAAAAVIYEIIDREPPIDSSSEEGLQPENLTGNIEFENVHFNYPTRPDVTVLNGLNLRVKKGETVALVGESGCGKSTTVQLLQRFYDPLSGIVKLDGCDIRLLNVGWLRDHIGIVGQEPVLFGTTIAENIRYGKDDATQEDIEKAAKAANAHNFIMKLPQKYDTLVGDRGTQLSGGQKQRVAIARALIKDPQILLLDEATSALDSESEAVVQHALDKASQGRTTIIIAHRLSTIRNADKIAAFSKGKIVELGTHEELMDIGGIYYTLVTTQTGGDKDRDIAPEGINNIPDQHNKAMLEYQRSLSISSANSWDEVTQGVAPLARVASFRQKTRVGSITSEDLKEEKLLKPSMSKIMRENKDEAVFIFFGCVGALGMGFSSPAFAIIFGDIMGSLSKCDPDEVRDESVFYSCLFLAIGGCTGIFMFLQIFMFSYAGEYLTLRLRKKSFMAMLRQEIGWFDDQNNSVGALCTRLSSDAASVQGATGSRIGTILQSICTLGASTIIALVLCWQLALVNMCFIPLVLFAAYMHGKMLQGQSVVEMVSLDSANKIAIEAISNIRTVASLHKERKFQEKYKNYLKKPHRDALRAVHIRGFIFGFSQSIAFFAYATSMWYGGTLILDGKVDYETVFKVAELLILGTMMVGQAFSFAPNANKGIVSAARIFLLLERKSLIDSTSDSGDFLPDDTPGLIEFKGAKFQYPTRQNVPVLRNLNLTIKPGHVVALVGSSGCGKSTCIQLLERFYDPADGIVEMDSKDLRQLNLRWLRSRIGIVSQEPILFDRSIKENIAYGDNTRIPEMDEIIKAAISANIHNFITSLPHGYETSVGDKGAQLSGGQKQRIAIARALLRNPKILLLDEATSALDTESEKVVQEALDQAQKGRTCITVAHRLSTIKDADQIAVINHGEVVEIGTHNELLALKGHYYRFYQTQAKGHA